MGERLKELRNERGLSVRELGGKIGKSGSTISRYETGNIAKWDPELVAKMAKVLSVSSAYLLGMTDDYSFTYNADVKDYIGEDNPANILVTDDEMSPEIPYGALVKIRSIHPEEILQIGSFYYIEFDGKKCFRMAIEDHVDGKGFLPNDMSERRISYDPDYVTIIGKAISMKVIFEDNIEYE